jgi:hypothetical protein
MVLGIVEVKECFGRAAGSDAHFANHFSVHGMVVVLNPLAIFLRFRTIRAQLKCLPAAALFRVFVATIVVAIAIRRMIGRQVNIKRIVINDNIVGFVSDPGRPFAKE